MLLQEQVCFYRVPSRVRTNVSLCARIIEVVLAAFASCLVFKYICVRENATLISFLEDLSFQADSVVLCVTSL